MKRACGDMQKLVTSVQMKEMDRVAIEEMKVPSTLLMMAAAEHVAGEAIKYLPPGGKCAIFAGSGNNGGDGIGAAIELVKRGYEVGVFLTGKREKMTPDCVEMERRLIEIGGELVPFDLDEEGTAAEFLKGCHVIIDAIFGIGLNSGLRDGALRAVNLINTSPARVIATDMASGVEADTGHLLGGAVKADVTVTFTFAKPGQYIEPGATYSGEVIVKNIGIPQNLADDLRMRTFLVTEKDVFLPARASNTHKGDYGKLLMVCGSTGYTGAPTLASSAAIRTGAGLVTLGVPESIYEITAAKSEEAMPYPLPADDWGRLSERALGWIIKKLRKSDACLIGPGLGRSGEVEKIVHEVIRFSPIPLIIDADGINAVAANINVLDEARCPVVLTPHEGEFMRLAGEEAKGGRLEAARAFAKKHRCTVVLKGPGTVSAFQSGEVCVNTTGNPGMAKGGSGDVLAGIVASLVGQKIPIRRAVYTAVWVHGRAGDVLQERQGSYTMMPNELTEVMPEILKNIER